VLLCRKHVCESARPKFYAALIDLFEQEDCDTLCEVDDPEFVKVMKKKYPKYYEDDE
jgi:hypothetical protein